LPDSIPFEGVNPIDEGYNSQATPALTIYGYVEEGGIRATVAPTSWIIPVYYYEEEEDLNETNKQKEQDINLFLVGIPGYLLISLIFISLTTWKMNKDKRKM